MTADGVIKVRQPNLVADYMSLSNMAEKLAAYHGEKMRPDPDKLDRDQDWFSSAIASINGCDVGYVGWHRMYACQSASRYLELQNLYVDPAWRKKKIGARLVWEVVKQALMLEATIGIGVRKENVDAVAFYKALGCEIIDRNDLWRCRWGSDKIKAFDKKARETFIV